jgi:hypothetical protein
MTLTSFTYTIDSIFSLVSGITFTKVYDVDKQKNAILLDNYGMSRDEFHLFMNYIKIAADKVWDSVKCHSPNQEYEFDLLLPNGLRIIQYDLNIGLTNDSKIKDYILLTLRDYILKEWYLHKGLNDLYQIYEQQYMNNIHMLIIRACGTNADEGANIFTTRKGMFS